MCLFKLLLLIYKCIRWGNVSEIDRMVQVNPIALICLSGWAMSVWAMCSNPIDHRSDCYKIMFQNIWRSDRGLWHFYVSGQWIIIGSCHALLEVAITWPNVDISTRSPYPPTGSVLWILWDKHLLINHSKPTKILSDWFVNSPVSVKWFMMRIPMV